MCRRIRGGLKLLEHVMKVLERVVEKQIKSTIEIDDMQFGFMQGHDITDATFILRQLQEKFHAKNKNLYFAFIDLEKGFHRVPCQVLVGRAILMKKAQEGFLDIFGII